ncbi:MAG: hypothetical protein AB7U73_00935 [Pirellulales bacterium]
MKKFALLALLLGLGLVVGCNKPESTTGGSDSTMPAEPASETTTNP